MKQTSLNHLGDSGRLWESDFFNGERAYNGLPLPVQQGGQAAAVAMGNEQVVDAGDGIHPDFRVGRKAGLLVDPDESFILSHLIFP